MTKRAMTLMIALPALAWAAWATAADDKAHKLSTVSLRKMADSLHAVIVADQRAYLEEMTPLQPAGDKPAGHAAVLRSAARSIQQHGAEFSYTLRSLQPMEPRDGPQTEVEQKGLEHVALHPDDNYYAEEELGGRAYFTAVYAERASAASCVECHNAHPKSQRRDWKLGDVMGGLVIRVPLEF